MITYDRQTTHTLYGIPTETEYGRWCMTFANGASAWRNMVNQRIRGLPGVLNTTRILVVGCGLGGLVEGLRDEGFQRVWGINLNDYFGSLWDQATCPVMGAGAFFIDPVTKAQSVIAEGQRWPCEVRSDIRPLLGKFDIRTLTQTQVGQLTGLSGAQRAFDYIITEDALTAYPDAEMTAFFTGCEARLASGGRIVHMLSLNFDGTPYGGATSRTLAQWQALRGAPHSFQDIAGISETVA